MEIRKAAIADIGPIARLHADNWRRTYRGMFSDQYLDGDLEGDRHTVWTKRLSGQAAETIWVAETPDGTLTGFVYCMGAHHPKWGSLVENLHVAYGYQSAGLGRRLLGTAAGWAAQHHPDQGIYLEVVVGNTRARAFYDAVGGRCGETFAETFDPWASGESDRMVWDTPADLLRGVNAARAGRGGS